jgi:hypothetical protein
MKKRIAAIMVTAVFTALVPCLGAQEGMIRECTGTVEIKAPGSASWIPAARGMKLGLGAVVSTSFRSTAVIVLGNSTLLVQPLTRLSLEEIQKRAGDEQVSLNLRTGRIRVNVQPPAEGRTEFTVRSPIATASVRGTVFEFDTVNLRVEEGTVLFSGDDGRNEAVAAGETSRVEEGLGRAEAPREMSIEELAPALPSGSDSGMAVLPEQVPPDTLAEYIIDLNW